MADFGGAPADLFHMLMLTRPRFALADEPLNVGPGFVRALLVAAVHDHGNRVLFEEPCRAPHIFEGGPVVDIEGEVAAGMEGAGGATHHLAEIALVGDVIEGIEFTGDEIDGAREAEVAHVGAEDLYGQAGVADFLAGDAAHVFGKVDGVDADAELGEGEGESAGAAAEIAGGLHFGQQGFDDGLAGGFEGPAKLEEVIVVAGQPVVGIGRHRWGQGSRVVNA